MCLWPPSSEAVVQRLYIMKECEHIANSTGTQSEAESSCSNTMIVCLSLPVVRALHQPIALMTACHTKVAHLPSTEKRFFFFFFLSVFYRHRSVLSVALSLSLHASMYLSLFHQSPCLQKVRNEKRKRNRNEEKEKMTGIEREMETREGGNLSGVCVCVFSLSKGQVNRPAEYLMPAGTQQTRLSPCSGCL